MGCVSYSPNQELIGQDRASVTKQLGRPERERQSENKLALHFPRGPTGSQTYFVYLNDNDQVQGWEQVLTEERFSQIKPEMTKEQVIDLIGVSKITYGLARDRGYVWHYRYFNHQCKSFVIEFTNEDVVRSASYRVRGGRKCLFVGQG